MKTEEYTDILPLLAGFIVYTSRDLSTCFWAEKFESTSKSACTNIVHSKLISTCARYSSLQREDCIIFSSHLMIMLVSISMYLYY